MAKIIDFPDKSKQEWSDEKLKVLMDAINNLPSDEQETLLAVKQIAELQQVLINSMQIKDYELFYHIKLAVEDCLQSISTGDFRHDSN